MYFSSLLSKAKLYHERGKKLLDFFMSQKISQNAWITCFQFPLCYILLANPPAINIDVSNTMNVTRVYAGNFRDQFLPLEGTDYRLYCLVL